MRFEIVDPFIEVIKYVCSDLLKLNIEKEKVFVKTGKKTYSNIAFYFKIKGDFRGTIVYEIDETLALELVKRVFQTDLIPDDPEVLSSGIGEIYNIINGKLLENIYKKGLKYTISHPISIRSKGKIVSYYSPCVEVHFTSIFGKLVLSVVFDSLYI